MDNSKMYLHIHKTTIKRYILTHKIYYYNFCYIFIKHLLRRLQLVTIKLTIEIFFSCRQRVPIKQKTKHKSKSNINVVSKSSSCNINKSCKSSRVKYRLNMPPPEPLVLRVSCFYHSSITYEVFIPVLYLKILEKITLIIK